ncbi:hypothetical protein [Halobellus rufus]|uniref:hypothetical protein n=1 Tax=Halobellus rufus TaxID=1448860 RepID=UPI0006786105|nr:hypothetical protein [Halobellus rufus]
MVPDDASRYSASSDADEPIADRGDADESTTGPADGVNHLTADGGRRDGNAVDDATYDLMYRAAREAIWDVLGTATLVLFHLALAAIALSIAVGGIGPFLRGSASYAALGVGVVALAVGVFAALRVYRLVTE